MRTLCSVNMSVIVQPPRGTRQGVGIWTTLQCQKVGYTVKRNYGVR